MITELKGRRLADTDEGDLPQDYQAGDYWKVLKDGTPKEVATPTKRTKDCWLVVAPMSFGDALGNLESHTVREHEDGTISVLPGDGSSNSILITARGEQWHGYIYNGIWRAC